MAFRLFALALCVSGAVALYSPQVPWTYQSLGMSTISGLQIDFFGVSTLVISY